MNRNCGFVSHPCVLLSQSRTIRRCRRSPFTHAYQQRNGRVLVMRTESLNEERNAFSERNAVDDAVVSDAPEIVEVGEGDEEDEVLSVLGPELDAFNEKRKKVRSRTREFLNEIAVEPDSAFANDANEQPPVDLDETAQFVRTAVRACDERKGENILAIRISKLTYITSFIVLVTGNNTPQIRAIANLVEEDLAKKHGMLVRRTDGTANSGWMLLDYGDFMVNIFSPEQRQNYKLEALWKEGESLDISDCVKAPEDRAKEEEVSPSALDDWLTDDR